MRVIEPSFPHGDCSPAVADLAPLQRRATQTKIADLAVVSDLRASALQESQKIEYR
jgi:hypothetical protein